MNPGDNAPLKWSDLIAPDDSIQNLLSELKNVRAQYVQAADAVVASANDMSSAMKGVSGATSEQQTKIKQSASAAEKLAQKHEQLTKGLSDTEKALIQVNRELKKKQNLEKLEEKIANTLEGSYDRMSATYSKLKLEYNALSKAERENADVGGKLATQLRLLYEEMDRIQQGTGKYQLGVGQYGRAINGLNQAASQLVRELPSATVSASTFFLAISNNIPIFVDQIQQLKRVNADLVASGKPGINVLKQTLKSFVSWNTLLVLGITLLTQYGGKLVEWVQGLIKGKESLDIAREASKKFNETVSEGSKRAVDSTSKLRILYNAATDEARSMEERLSAVRELKSEYPAYFQDLTNEEILVGKAKAAYDSLNASLVEQARARAYLDGITENQKEIIRLEAEYADERQAVADAEKSVLEAEENLKKVQQDPTAKEKGEDEFWSRLDLAEQQVKYAKQYLEARKADLQVGLDQIAVLEETNKKLEAGIKISSLVSDDPKKITKPEEDVKMRELEFIRALEDAKNNALEEGYEKELIITTTAIDRKIEDLKREYTESKDITEEGQAAILELIQFYENYKAQKALEIKEKWDKKRQDQEQKELDARNKAAKKEAAEAQRARMIWYRTQVDMIDQTYELELAQIDATEDNESKKTRLRLLAEKNRWQAILKLNREQGQILTDTELKTIEEYIKAIDKEYKKAGPRDLYDLLGLGLDEDQKQAIDMVLSSVMDSLNEIADAYVKAAQAAVDSANDRVSAAQTVLDAERTARANGYASEVENAQKELMLAKQTQQQALHQQKEAQKAQEAIATVSQAVNMVSATALIWSQLGFPWAIPAIAVMWGAFAAAKINAAQIAKQTNYGDGMVEYLDYGGSHASGNDIDFGVAKDGTRRRVERGEMISVINKRSVAKMGAERMSSILNSLNDGTFDSRFGMSVAYIGNEGKRSTDLTRLEKGVTSLIKQGEKRVYVSDGRIIEITGNRKRIIKS